MVPADQSNGEPSEGADNDAEQQVLQGILDGADENVTDLTSGLPPPPPPPTTPVPEAEYKSMIRVARALQVCFAFWMVLGGLAAASSLVWFRVVDRVLDDPFSVTFSQMMTAADRQDGIGVVQLIALILVGILFLVWMSGTYQNLPALGRTPRFKQGWAVGGWFVPFLNLWRPKQIIDEIWTCRPAEEGERPTVAPLLNWWWGLWVVGGIFGWLLFRNGAPSSGDGARTRAMGMLLADVAEVAAAVLAFWVVTAITKRQAAQLALMRADSAGSDEVRNPEASSQRSLVERHSVAVAVGLPLLAVISFGVAFVQWDDLNASSAAGGGCLDDGIVQAVGDDVLTEAGLDTDGISRLDNLEAAGIEITPAMRSEVVEVFARCLDGEDLARAVIEETQVIELAGVAEACMVDGLSELITTGMAEEFLYGSDSFTSTKAAEVGLTCGEVAANAAASAPGAETTWSDGEVAFIAALDDLMNTDSRIVGVDMNMDCYVQSLMLVLGPELSNVPDMTVGDLSRYLSGVTTPSAIGLSVDRDLAEAMAEADLGCTDQNALMAQVSKVTLEAGGDAEVDAWKLEACFDDALSDDVWTRQLTLQYMHGSAVWSEPEAADLQTTITEASVRCMVDLVQ